MSFQEFCATIAAGTPAPTDGGAPLRALWHDARGDWNEAHAVAQSDAGPDAAWVHAYLHRQEGDLANAAYWYRRAGRTMPTGLTLEAEWQDIARTLIERAQP